MISISELLAEPRWIRWRLHLAENAVRILDDTAAVLATARATGTSRRRNLVAAGVRGLLPGGDRLGEHWDWELVAGYSGPTMATARRAEPPRGVRGPLDASYRVDAADAPVGTIGRASQAAERLLTSHGGAVSRFVVGPGAKEHQASPATTWDAGGVMLAEIVPGYRSAAQQAAPTDGMVCSLDVRLLPKAPAPPGPLLLTLFASILDTQVRDESVSSRPGWSGASWEAPADTERSSALRAGQDRAADAVHDQHVAHAVELARRRGNEALAARLEQRRRRQEP